MATGRVVGMTTRCVACQRLLLSSFMRAFSPVSQRESMPHPARRVQEQRRHFASALRTRHVQESVSNEAESWWNRSDEAVEIPAVEEAQDQGQTEVTSVPWYLQKNEPEGAVSKDDKSPFAERQRIPELPESPPPILEPLLKHISVDLGMDYLSVMDLRHLDPPPALGANLLMILGSARSEKHLNISADRLCRWLRTEYKLSPFADGLLGRNELKLKMRRKARRTRMLSAAGASPDSGEKDDGIKTGWICVNVGTVDDGSRGGKNVSPATDLKNFVGFGQQSSGARIVVQLMTEEKRGETDLEGLWQGILGRSLRKQKGDREAKEEARVRKEGDSVMGGATSTSDDYRGRGVALDGHISPSLLSNQQQVRGLHTSARSPAADLTRDHEPQHPDNRLAGEVELDESELEPRLMSNDTEKPLVPVNNDQGEIGSIVALRALLDYILHVPPSTALQELGHGENDCSSTSFLANFYHNFPAFPQMTHWDAALRLQRRALEVGHAGYSKRHLMDMFRFMQASMTVIPLSPFRVVLKALLLTPHGLDETSTLERADHAGYHALRRSLGWAFEVIEKMEVYGHDVCRPNIWRIFHEAVSFPRFAAPAPGTVTHLPADTVISLAPEMVLKHQYYVRRAIELMPVTPDDKLYTEMLQTYTAQGNWSAFWDTWRTMARLLHPRSADMYVLMFDAVAASRDEKRCQEVLEEHVGEMAKERPAVPFEGDEKVKGAIRRCLLAANVDHGSRQWATLWERCQPDAAEAAPSLEM